MIQFQLDMRIQDNAIARSLLERRQEVLQAKAVTTCDQHATMIDDYSWELEKEDDIAEQLRCTMFRFKLSQLKSNGTVIFQHAICRVRWWNRQPWFEGERLVWSLWASVEWHSIRIGSRWFSRNWMHSKRNDYCVLWIPIVMQIISKAFSHTFRRL